MKDYATKIRRQRRRVAKYVGRGTFTAILQTVLNFAPWRPFLWLALGSVVICYAGQFLVLAVSRIIGYVCVALHEVCKVINKVLNSPVLEGVARAGAKFVCTLKKDKKCLDVASNQTRDFLPNINVDQFKYLSQLAKGHCQDFDTAWKVLTYVILAAAGGQTLCDDLEWFESITLTRYVVFYPATVVFWTDSENNCHTSTATNVCAFGGFDLVFRVLLYRVVLPLVVLVGCWPLIKNTLRICRAELFWIVYEVKYWTFRLHPTLGMAGGSPFWRRLARRKLH